MVTLQLRDEELDVPIGSLDDSPRREREQGRCRRVAQPIISPQWTDWRIRPAPFPQILSVVLWHD